MSLMPLGNLQLGARRREPFLTPRGNGRAGTLESDFGGIGIVPRAGIGGLAGARGGGGLGLLGLGYGGICPGVLIRGEISPFSPNRDIMGGTYPDALLQNAPCPGRRAPDGLGLAPRLGHYPHRDLGNLLGINDSGQGLRNARGCSGHLGCGYDGRCDHEQCTYEHSRGLTSSTSSGSKELNMKDIVVRGKTFKIRKSFLADSSKFEADIVKLLDKKSEVAVPNNVVQMLVDFINSEGCDARTLLDVACMNILASSLAVKSAVDFSLGLLKKYDVHYNMDTSELTQICLAIMESSKVDDKLVAWLKKYLTLGERWYQLQRSHPFQDMIRRKPQLRIHLAQLIGEMEKDENEGEYRVI